MNEYTFAIDRELKPLFMQKLSDLENELNSDVIFFYGPIYPSQEIVYRDLIEGLQDDDKHETLSVVLNTPGGDVITVEKLANINRKFYNNVNFIVPDLAMSAGTVFCLSGNDILMEYSSSLGPVDPQVQNSQGVWVPALGYIDKMNEAIQKSQKGTLSNLEYMLLSALDIGFLRNCEQQANLTVQLIKDWLVRYKFSNWNVHEKTKTPVTREEKEKRAEEIANMLGDNNLWCTHGRFIDITKLREILKLKVHDYGEKPSLKTKIREYNALILSYINRNKNTTFYHSRKFF